jgi:hypothetical protein
MSSPTTKALSEILREIYMGPPRVDAEPIKWWSCKKHKYPVSDRYKDVCEFDPECDEYECPHHIQVKIADGCAECKTATWLHVLDGETGEPAYEARISYGLQYEMSHSVLLEALSSELPKHSPK